MKYLLIVGDGMADFPIKELDGKTPLEAVEASGMARIAGGQMGRIRTCPQGLPAGSDVGFLTLLGQNALKCYRGRSPLEAAGEQVELKSDEVSFRMNLISVNGAYPDGTMASYNGDGIEGEEAFQLVNDLIHDAHFSKLLRECGMRITLTDTFRHIAVMHAEDSPFELTPAHDIAGQHLSEYLPKGQRATVLHMLQAEAHRFLSTHPLNLERVQRGRLMVNGIWFWGAGRATILENLSEKYGIVGTAVSAVPLVRGIAWLSGLKAPHIQGATGELNTNYQEKVRVALEAFYQGDDFVLLHLEAPDDMSHLGDLEGKLESIRRLDKRLIQPMLKALDAWGEAYRVLLMPDHYTLLSTCTHDGTPVPFAIYDNRAGSVPRPFTEAACADMPILESGDALMKLFLNKE